MSLRSVALAESVLTEAADLVEDGLGELDGDAGLGTARTLPGQRGSPERHAFDDAVDRLASRFAVPAGFMQWRLFDLAKMRQSHFAI